MNKVIIEGTLTTQPVLRFGIDDNGEVKVVATFSISNLERHKNYKKTNYFNVAIWDTKGEEFATRITKGYKVLIYGKLKNRTYENGEIKKKITEVVADEVKVLGKK